MICTRCVYDDTVPNIIYDENGVCNYCHQHDELCKIYPTGEEGKAILNKLADRIRKDGKGKKYDVAIGVSGGCGSTYMLAYTKNILKLRPIAIHFDNGWNTSIGSTNLENAVNLLGVDLWTYKLDPKECDDYLKSFLLAGVNDIDTPTDIALTSVLYMGAEKHGCRWLFEGHSFRTEGICPLGWIYMDGKYVQSVYDKYGNGMTKTFPNLTMAKFLYWSAWKGIRRIRPMYYIDYDKEKAKEMLADEFGWEWYGGHHCENQFTTSYWNYYLPQRYGIDGRLLGHAALVRSGQLKREDALTDLRRKPTMTYLDVVLPRMGMNRMDYDDFIQVNTRRTWKDFDTYKKTFERTKWFWWLMMKLNRCPRSFWLKFCHKEGYLK